MWEIRYVPFPKHIWWLGKEDGEVKEEGLGKGREGGIKRKSRR